MNLQSAMRFSNRASSFDFGHDRIGRESVPSERLSPSRDPFAVLYRDGITPSSSMLSEVKGHSNNMALQNVGATPSPVGNIAPDTFKIRVYGDLPLDRGRNPGLSRLLSARIAAETKVKTRKLRGKTQKDLRDLLYGLDAYASGLSDDKPEESLSDLEQLMDELRGLPAVEGDDDCFMVGSIPFRVYPHGSASHTLMLKNETLNVTLHVFGSMENLGLVAGAFGARWCVEYGYDAAKQLLREFCDLLEVSITRDVLSEIHLKADVEQRFTVGIVRHLRGYGVKSLSSFGHGEDWTGFSTVGSGKRSSEKVCDLVLYDKREAEKADPYWLNYWRACGLDDARPLWRLECRFYRGGLKRFGVESASDLTPEIINDLWSYATGTYLVLCTKRTSDNRPEDRRISPLWETLQACAPEFRPTAPARPERVQTCDFLPVMRQAFGCFRSGLFRAGVLASESVLVDMVNDFGAAADAVQADLRSVYADGLRGLADCLDKQETTLPETGLIDAFRAECFELYEERKPSLGVDYIPAFRPLSWYEERETVDAAEVQ